jgi:hypothetical protein
MEWCDCRADPKGETAILTLECLECAGQVVRCRDCGQPAWWTERDRIRTLNAAEAHRWETGHARVVVRTSAGRILREVGEWPTAA